MRRQLIIFALALLIIALGLAVIGPGSIWVGWAGASVLLLAAGFGLYFAWRWAGGTRTLAWQTGLAFALRLGVGVLLLVLLPLAGFKDNPVNQAGYSYSDAFNRDNQAWTLAQSDQSLGAAFSQEFSADQYGGMLSLSATLYRTLSPDAHRQWLILIVTAFVSALGVPFLFKALALYFSPAVAGLAVWIYALYPESVLLGGAQMRDPILIGLGSILLWAASDWRRLKWKSAALAVILTALMASFSWLVALPVAGIILVWWWVDFSGDLTRKQWRWLGWIAIGVLGAAALAGMAAWLRESAIWDSVLTVQNSGKIQVLYERMPVFLRSPFLLVYGLLQPVLPAAIFDASVPIWSAISIIRSIGWYALLPLLVYGLPAFFHEERGVKRGQAAWALLAFTAWAALSSFRAGGDLWDNPRYRTLLLPFLALAAAWAWTHGRIRKDAWLTRIYFCEAAFLAAFSVWYAGRSIQAFPKTSFEETLGIILVAWVVIFISGWVADALKNARTAPANLLSIESGVILRSVRTLCLLATAVSAASLYLPAAYLGVQETWFEFIRWYHHGLPGITILAALVVFAASYTPVKTILFILTRQWLTDLNRHRWLGAALLALFMLPLPVMQLVSQLGKARPYLPPLWLFGMSVVAGAAILWSLRPVKGVQRVLGAATVLFAAAYLLAMQLPRITNYPFSLDWSEGSRIYEASQVYSLLVYGVRLPLPLLDVGRAFLQGLPFLIPGLPISMHRLWLLLLEMGGMAGAGILLARRLKIKNRGIWAMFVLWVVLFLNQGPVFPHLMLVALLILALYDSQQPWKSLLWVLLASSWAGLTRLNWFPLAGSLAALLYVLETPQGKKPIWKYLLPPGVYILAGTATAVLVYLGYVQGSGNPTSDFGTSFSSILIWERLWPNASFKLGIIPGIILVSLPLVAMASARLIRSRGAWRPARLAAIAGILLVFLLGGSIVSLKIGGGNNLHNLDAFLLLLLVASSMILAERFLPDAPRAALPVRWAPAWLALVVLIPTAFALFTIQPHAQPTQASTTAALNYIQGAISRANQKGQSVLFMSERQLLAFHQVPDVKIVPEYERVVIAEMAMAENKTYIDQYQADIQAKKFDLILVEPLRIEYLDTNQYLFAQENNHFVDYIFSPIAENYHADRIFKDVGVAVMVPNADEGGIQ